MELIAIKDGEYSGNAFYGFSQPIHKLTCAFCGKQYTVLAASADMQSVASKSVSFHREYEMLQSIIDDSHSQRHEATGYRADRHYSEEWS